MSEQVNNPQNNLEVKSVEATETTVEKTTEAPQVTTPASTVTGATAQPMNSVVAKADDIMLSVQSDAPAPEKEPASVQTSFEEPQAKSEEGTQPSIFSSMPSLKFDSSPHNVFTNTRTTSDTTSNLPDSIDMPAAPSATQDELIRLIPNLRDVQNQSDRIWGSTLISGAQAAPVTGVLEEALARPGSKWTQGMTHNGEIYRSVIPSFSTPSNTELSGEQGLQRAYSHMGMGDMFHAAMWNSGFWVTFTPAPEVVWMNINRLLGTNVMGISRETYGLLHSTATSLAVSTIINSLLPYVYATTVNAKQMTIRDIPKYLKTNDEHDFIWGFIAANFSRGVNIDRSCVANPNKCRAVISERLDVTELQICDETLLPPENIPHMRMRGHGQMSLESVIEYQKRMDTHISSVITLTSSSGASAKFHLKVPSSEKKSRMSDAYIAEIKSNILATVTDESPPDSRQVIYEELSSATELCLYQHWVDRISIVDGNNNVITDEKTISSTMAAWSRDPSLRDQFFEAMNKFISHSCASVIGLEPLTCPQCGSSHSRPEQALRGAIDYVPLDIIQVFSSLADFKTRLVQARS